MNYKTIIAVPEEKFEILKKGQNAGLDLRLSCPDNLACHDKGIDISWLGEIIINEKDKFFQIQIITNQLLNSFNSKHPLMIFINSFQIIHYIKRT